MFELEVRKDKYYEVKSSPTTRSDPVCNRLESVVIQDIAAGITALDFGVETMSCIQVIVVLVVVVMGSRIIAIIVSYLLLL